ncbi:hypothetical protein HMF8227_00376 [Saliniradius amylolyticus]|uniref:Uncharacterized protein n=1 Tax=Saliniradius amylolyticus TaxID=2183582 RepID=A0A2S2E018_9ALTE|nr:DUF393 domain-containing protein [Saliniradius amylolyticus]AWL10882.1 hypothetical protein HMF8227_00376 [Saliniradius amylolyticus]
MLLTLFYDGLCPLCQKEMSKLSQLDTDEKLRFVDIQQPDFEQRYPQIDYQAANERLHAITEQGEILTGLDVTYRAWQAVGHGWLIAPLRWPVVRIVADWAYAVFARHRYLISFVLTGQSRCRRCKVRQ